ncbi:helix-turn-helix domain-containing protein [Enterococcus olivae]
MYSLLKKIITEKDIHRHVSLLEQLLNHPKITAKELSLQIQTTERTIFSDLQLIREQLPDGWQIETSAQGIQLIKEKNQSTNELWTLFLPQSISVRFIKELFFHKVIKTSEFLRANGLSLETLKRHTSKINQHLLAYNINIQLTAKQAKLSGEESAIRVFFHRLLIPFTHNNYFFEEYVIHEEHYFQFLNQLNRSSLAVETEQIFGTCWFFINTIRIKANCRVHAFRFNEKDPLYQLYRDKLKKLYEKEGVYLLEEEAFFAFFCFLESWNYNNKYSKKNILTNFYPVLATIAEQLTAQVSQQSQVDFQYSSLSENLLLLLLKYSESTWLSEQFQLEYQELIAVRKDSGHYRSDEEILAILQPAIQLKNPKYLINLISLLEQQAFFALRPELLTVYFLFQGEPAWKVFLQQELTDLLGRRIHLKSLELTQLYTTKFSAQDLIVSNFSLEDMPVPVIHISNIPTKNELRQLTELTLKNYLL